MAPTHSHTPLWPSASLNHFSVGQDGSDFGPLLHDQSEDHWQRPQPHVSIYPSQDEAQWRVPSSTAPTMSSKKSKLGGFEPCNTLNKPARYAQSNSSPAIPKRSRADVQAPPDYLKRGPSQVGGREVKRSKRTDESWPDLQDHGHFESSRSSPRALRSEPRPPLKSIDGSSAVVALNDYEARGTSKNLVSRTGFRELDQMMNSRRSNSHTRAAHSVTSGSDTPILPSGSSHSTGTRDQKDFHDDDDGNEFETPVKPVSSTFFPQYAHHRVSAAESGHLRHKFNRDRPSDTRSDSPDPLALDGRYPDYHSGAVSVAPRHEDASLKSRPRPSSVDIVTDDEDTSAASDGGERANIRPSLRPADTTGKAKGHLATTIKSSSKGALSLALVASPCLNIACHRDLVIRRGVNTAFLLSTSNNNNDHFMPKLYDVVVYEEDSFPSKVLLMSTKGEWPKAWMLLQVTKWEDYGKLRQMICGAAGDSVEEQDVSKKTLNKHYQDLQKASTREETEKLIRKICNIPTEPRTRERQNAPRSQIRRLPRSPEPKQVAREIPITRRRGNRNDITYEGIEDVPSPPPERRVQREQKKAPEAVKRFDDAVKNGRLKEWKEPLSLAPIGRNRATVEWNDLSRLNDDEFLNDNLISYFLLREQHQDHGKKRKDEVYVFNTYFYEALTQNVRSKGVNYDKVKRWTKGQDIFKYRYIVVPINKNLHWYCAIICNVDQIELLAEQEEQDNETNLSQPLNGVIDLSEVEKKRGGGRGKRPGERDPLIVTLDSLDNPHPEVARNLKDYLLEEAQTKLGKRIKQLPAGITAKGMPTQSNMSDCGLYVIAYFKKFLKDPQKFVHASLNVKSEDKNSYWGTFDSGGLRRQCLDSIAKEYAKQHDLPPPELGPGKERIITLEDDTLEKPDEHVTTPQNATASDMAYNIPHKEQRMSKDQLSEIVRDSFDSIDLGAGLPVGAESTKNVFSRESTNSSKISSLVADDDDDILISDHEGRESPLGVEAQLRFAANEGISALSNSSLSRFENGQGQDETDPLQRDDPDVGENAYSASHGGDTDSPLN